MVSFPSTFHQTARRVDSLDSDWTEPPRATTGLRPRPAAGLCAPHPVTGPPVTSTSLAPAHPVARLAIGTQLNGNDCWIPTEFAHSSRWTETCHVAQIVRDAGGFEARTFCSPITTAQIWLTGCPDSSQAERHIRAAAAELLQVGLGIEPGQRLPIGSIPALNLFDHGDGTLEAVLYVERADELCSRVMKAAARAIGPRLAHLAETRRSPDIQHGVVEHERVRARCRLSPSGLARGHARQSNQASGVRRVIGSNAGCEHEFSSDRHEPVLAETHNSHVLEGLAAAAAGSNIDPACFTVEARSYAARWGSCEPLVRWRLSGDMLLGELNVPVDLATIGDSLVRHVQHEVSFQTVRDITIQVSTIGLASSVAYLRSSVMARS
jgi:hydroxymethylglutaryl-CoA reductase